VDQEQLTNMNPIQGLSSANPRINQIEDYWRQYPGAAPGGTGPTGLASNDAQGWSQLLNDQTEHQNLINSLTGAPPVTVKMGNAGGLPTDPGMASAAASPWGLGGTGPSAAMMNPPGIPPTPNPNRLTEPSAPINGLQAAKPMKKSTIQPLAGR